VRSSGSGDSGATSSCASSSCTGSARTRGSHTACSCTVCSYTRSSCNTSSARGPSGDGAGPDAAPSLIRTLHLVVAVVALALAATAGCRSVVPPDPARFESVAPRLGQLLLVGFRGTAEDAEDDLQRLICGVRVGGVLLFGRNVVDPAQVGR